MVPAVDPIVNPSPGAWAAVYGFAETTKLPMADCIFIQAQSRCLSQIGYPVFFFMSPFQEFRNAS
jgi:hypothetical protein